MLIVLLLINFGTFRGYWVWSLIDTKRELYYKLWSTIIVTLMFCLGHRFENRLWLTGCKVCVLHSAKLGGIGLHLASMCIVRKGNREVTVPLKE